jgi:hypothetical protein
VLKIERNKYWLSILNVLGAYPDALEYMMTIKRRCLGTDLGRWKECTKKNGCKIDMPVHKLFVVNKDKENKINNDLFRRWCW